jgi:hypothetical protein
VSTYFFRPVMPGICAECDEPYPALTDYMHLTEKGIVHPNCDFQPEDEPKPKQRRPKSTVKRPRSRANLRVLNTAPRTDDIAAGADVCRKCWTVQPCLCGGI